MTVAGWGASIGRRNVREVLSMSRAELSDGLHSDVLPLVDSPCVSRGTRERGLLLAAMFAGRWTLAALASGWTASRAQAADRDSSCGRACPIGLSAPCGAAPPAPSRRLPVRAAPYRAAPAVLRTRESAVPRGPRLRIHRSRSLWPAVIAAMALACLAPAASAGAAESGAAAGAQPAQPDAARIVVGFRALSRAQREALLASYGVALRRFLPRLSAAAASVPAGERDAILARLRANTSVKFAEPDRRVTLVRPVTGSRLRFARAARTPNDTGFSYQYSLRQPQDHDVDATNAWDSRTSCAKVAVLDTGVQTSHKDLKSNLWRNSREVPKNGKDDDQNGYVDDDYGVDLVRGHGSGIDHNGHGTHVAGIIAAHGNNDRGISGLCWSAQLVSVRFMDANGGGYTSDAAAGIVYAVNIGAHVINASYGSGTPTEVEREAIAYAASRDTLIVAAAGNDHVNADTKPLYPAAFPDANVISVAATDDRDHLAGFSNYGKRSVDLAAPGAAIASTWDDGGYREASGTSMAAPLVSAAAAMLRKQGYPPASRIRKLLLNNTDAKSGLSNRVASGGRLNVRRSLSAGA
jgi:hypothetical protein